MLTQPEKHFDLRALLRLGAWGGGAALALALAVFSTRSEIGAQRLAQAYTGTQTAARVNPDSLARTQITEDTRRLSDGMRTLAADRDRLLARVTVLERNLEDVTGSIGRAAEPRRDANPASSPLPAVNSISTLTGPTALSTAVTSATIPVHTPRRTAGLPPRALAPITMIVPDVSANAPADVETTQSIGTTSQFGVDIGGGASLEALRDLWTAAHGGHGAVLRGLRPVISVREDDKGIELRLIAGPLTNAGAAAKICASLAAGGWSCKPAIFDGQKLSLR